MKAITVETLFSGHFSQNDHKYADELFWSPERNSFIHRIVACYSGIDGTCQCNSHDTYSEDCISPDRAVELLKSWGIVLEKNVDVIKTRRRIEDALRKTNSMTTLLTIAKLLNVNAALLPQRFLMVSEPVNGCWRCESEEDDTSVFCNSCQDAYWSDRPEATNFDCPHATGISETRARADIRYRLAVKVADKR